MDSYGLAVGLTNEMKPRGPAAHFSPLDPVDSDITPHMPLSHIGHYRSVFSSENCSPAVHINTGHAVCCPMAEQQKKDYTVKSVERTIDIVEALRELGEVRVERIVERTGYSKSSVYSHLVTLEQKGYVIKEGGLYRLSLRFLTVGNTIRKKMSISETVKPYMGELAEETGTNVAFVVEENGSGVFLHRETGEHPLQTAQIGKRVPLHVTAAGKAILAFLPEPRVDQIIEEQGLSTVSKNTITDPEQLKNELKTIAEQGYAINHGERIERLRSVAVPLRNRNNYPLGAIALTNPRHLMSEQQLTEELPNILLAKADEIELNLTYS